MPDFVIKKWNLAPHPGDQAPPHVHHRSDEAFCVIRGRLEVLVGQRRQLLNEGDYVVIPAGTVHTFATVDDQPAEVLAVMTEEIESLVTALYAASSEEEQAGLWERYHSSVVEST